MKRLAGVTALVAIALGLSIWVGSRRANAGVLESRVAASAPSRISASTKRSSRLVLGRRVRCTATVRSKVQAGQAVSVRFVLHNVSKHPVKVFLWVFDARIVLRATDGTTYDSSAPLEGLPGIPPPVPTKVRPGATRLLRRITVPVRWSGPLRITPECLGKALPVFRVRVTSPGLPSDEIAAIDEVVAASGHLLDQCRPQTPGVPVYGQIDSPNWNAQPMSARCSLSLSSEGRFWVAQALVLMPPGLPDVQVWQPYETLWPNGKYVGLTGSQPPYEAIAWEFVVTKTRAIPVAAATLTATNSSGRTAPFWVWNGSGWRNEGSGSCGGTGFTWGGRGPEIEFISACPASTP